MFEGFILWGLDLLPTSECIYIYIYIYIYILETSEFVPWTFVLKSRESRQRVCKRGRVPLTEILLPRNAQQGTVCLVSIKR